MKIELLDKKIIIYLNNYYFNTNDKDKLQTEIKNLFIKLIKFYKLSFSGIYKVILYENKIYGSILEIIKKDELLFSRELIDIKVSVIKNNNIYLETDDYFVFKDYQNIFYKDNYYYLNILDTSNYLKLIEFCKIVYKVKKSDLKPL